MARRIKGAIIDLLRLMVKRQFIDWQNAGTIKISHIYSKSNLAIFGRHFYYFGAMPRIH